MSDSRDRAWTVEDFYRTLDERAGIEDAAREAGFEPTGESASPEWVESVLGRRTFAAEAPPAVPPGAWRRRLLLAAAFLVGCTVLAMTLKPWEWSGTNSYKELTFAKALLNAADPEVPWQSRLSAAANLNRFIKFGVRAVDARQSSPETAAVARRTLIAWQRALAKGATAPTARPGPFGTRPYEDLLAQVESGDAEAIEALFLAWRNALGVILHVRLSGTARGTRGLNVLLANARKQVRDALR